MKRNGNGKKWKRKWKWKKNDDKKNNVGVMNIQSGI